MVQCLSWEDDNAVKYSTSPLHHDIQKKQKITKSSIGQSAVSHYFI